MFLTTLQQVAILLIFIFVGYFFKKKDIINEGGKKVLAGLLTNLFAPAYSIISLSTVISIEEISKYSTIFLAGIIVTILGILVAIPFALLVEKDKFHRNILKYAFAFGNIGYFGYPLIYSVFSSYGGAILGAEVRAQMMLFCVPMSVAIYSYGYYILTTPVGEGVEREKRTLKQKLSFLYSAPMLGAIIGIVLGLLPIELPEFFTGLLNKAGDCQSAPAMILTGVVLAGVPFKQLFLSWKSYIIGFIRLLAIPVIFAVLLLIVYLCGWQDQTFMRIAFLTIIVSCMPVGMNTVVYPESCGMDSTEGAKSCFISYVLALGTLPLIFMLAIKMLGLPF